MFMFVSHNQPALQFNAYQQAPVLDSQNQCLNPYYFYYRHLLTCSKDEEVFRKSKTAGWFDAFYSNTDEKRVTATAVEKRVLEPLKDRIYSSLPLKVLDVGCCESDFPLQLMQIFHSMTEGQFFYFGIDRNGTAVRNVAQNKIISERQEGKKFSSDFYVADFFSLFRNEYAHMFDHSSERVKFGGQKFNLIICSHVAYYTKDISRFVDIALDTVYKNGFAVFIHESEQSLPKLRSKECGAPVQAQTSTLIQNDLKFKGINHYVFKVNSHIYLPLSIEDNIDTMLKINESCLSRGQLRLKKLIEYICQVPLETLHMIGKLSACIEGLGNVVQTESDIIIATLDSSIDFKLVFEGFVEPRLTRFEGVSDCDSYILPGELIGRHSVFEESWYLY